MLTGLCAAEKWWARFSTRGVPCVNTYVPATSKILCWTTSMNHISSFRRLVACSRGLPSPTRTCDDLIDRGGFLQKAANLDTLGFYNLFLVSWVTLVDRFKLNLLEAVSSFVAIIVCPNTSEPFAKVAVRMLSGNLKAPRPRGFDLGHELVKSIVDAYSTRKFGLRFSTYCAVNVPSIDMFCERCRLVFWTCIHVWATYPTKPANKEIHGIYAKISALF
jgi:hypothetical protein